MRHPPPSGEPCAAQPYTSVYAYAVGDTSVTSPVACREPLTSSFELQAAGARREASSRSVGLSICPRTHTKVTRRDLYQESCIRLTVVAVTALLRFAIVLISVDSAVSPVEDHAARVVNQTTHPTTLGSSSGSGESPNVKSSSFELTSYASAGVRSWPDSLRYHGLRVCFPVLVCTVQSGGQDGQDQPSPFPTCSFEASTSESGLCAFFVSLSRVCFCITCRCLRVTKEEEKGEFRPLVLKTDRESVLRGEDYWIDYNEVIVVSKSSCGSFQRCAPRPKALVLLAAAV